MGWAPSQVDVNGSLKSWLEDDNIIVIASFPESFRSVIAGPSECGKTFLLKNLFLSSIQFDRLYIIGPTGDLYEDLKYEEIVFSKEVKELPSFDQQPKNIKKLMIFDNVGEKNQLIMNTFVEVDIVIVIWYILNKNYSRQLDRMLERIVIYLFSLNKEAEPPRLYIKMSLIEQNLVMMILVIYMKRHGKNLLITSLLINVKTGILMEN